MNKKKIIVAVLLICLCIALAIILIPKDNKKEVIGTYCTGNELSPQNIYIAFSSDGAFNIYRQFEKLGNGSFSVENNGDNQRIILDFGTSEKGTAEFDRQDQLIIDGSIINSLPDEQISFSRISDVSMLINVPLD